MSGGNYGSYGGYGNYGGYGGYNSQQGSMTRGGYMPGNCFNCGGVGHWSKECPQKGRDQPPGDGSYGQGDSGDGYDQGYYYYGGFGNNQGGLGGSGGYYN